MASEEQQQGDQEQPRRVGGSREHGEQGSAGDDARREWGPRDASSGGDLARKDSSDREGARRFTPNRDSSGPGREPGAGRDFGSRDLGGRRDVGEGRGEGGYPRRESFPGGGGRDSSFGREGAGRASFGPRPDFEPRRDADRGERRDLPPREEERPSPRRENTFRSRSDREGGAPPRREFPRRDDAQPGSETPRPAPEEGERRESFDRPRREEFDRPRREFDRSERRDDFDRPRRDDMGPRREYSRDGARPYRSGFGAQRGTGGAYRPKGGPRPPLKKKKKARVYFHQALTRILLPKLLTKAKYLSPALARQFIEAGRVRVNARVVSSRFYEVNLRKERVTIDEAPTEYPRRLSYMIYNKPVGMVCEKGDPAFDAVFDPACTWSFPFGRLAKSVSGLVIVANDPRMASMQHHIDVELQKEYRLRLNKHLTDEQIEELRGGILVGDDYLVPLRVVPGPKNTHSMWIDLTLLDDSYHRVYGALKALGCEVVKMRRTRIALLNENMVPPGEWRELSGFEIAAFDLARFMPGELPPEPLPPPRPRPERPKNGRFSRDARGGPGPREGGPREGGGREGGMREGGPRDGGRGGDRGSSWGGGDRRGPGTGPGGRRFQPQRRRGEEDPDEREERLRKEAEADAIGNK